MFQVDNNFEIIYFTAFHPLQLFKLFWKHRFFVNAFRRVSDSFFKYLLFKINGPLPWSDKQFNFENWPRERVILIAPPNIA